jgi:hypothetical protein
VLATGDDTPLTLGFRAADFPAAYNMIDVFAVLAAAT